MDDKKSLRAGQKYFNFPFHLGLWWSETVAVKTCIKLHRFATILFSDFWKWHPRVPITKKGKPLPGLFCLAGVYRPLFTAPAAAVCKPLILYKLSWICPAICRTTCCVQ